MHVVICGAGYTGSRVFDLLPASETIRISRPAHDLDDPDVELPALPSTWALLYTVPPSPAADNDVRLERLLSKLSTPPVRIVYLSTSGVYGDRQGAVVTEQDPPAPLTARAQRRHAAEQSLDAWCAERNVERIILRVPAIYGPGRLGLDRIAAGTTIIREDEAPPGNRIHADDLATCCLRALEPSTPAGVYNVGDGDHRSSSGFSKTVAEIAGLEAPPEVGMTEAEEMFTESRLSFLRESRILDTTKMREVLGITPRYTDAAEGICASLQQA